MLFYRDIGIVPLLSLVPFVPLFSKFLYISVFHEILSKKGDKRDKGQKNGTIW
jgi:hypothetical protein